MEEMEELYVERVATHGGTESCASPVRTAAKR